MIVPAFLRPTLPIRAPRVEMRRVQSVISRFFRPSASSSGRVGAGRNEASEIHPARLLWAHSTSFLRPLLSPRSDFDRDRSTVPPHLLLQRRQAHPPRRPRRLVGNFSRSFRCCLVRQTLPGCHEGCYRWRRFRSVSHCISLRRRLNIAHSGNARRKVWDTVTGSALSTHTHQHIVRTVDLNHDVSKLLTGGNEKKLRIFDLTRPDGDGVEELKMDGEATAHKGTVRSACWDEGRSSIVSMGEDKVVRSVPTSFVLYCSSHGLRSARWWDTRTSAATHSITFAAPITSMEKSHDGELVSITSGNDVTFLDLTSYVLSPSSFTTPRLY